MTNENVKIRINEVNKTSPRGTGVDSTDIPFIPGFSILSDAPQVPTLCTSVKQFERLFGDSPRPLLPEDVTLYGSSCGICDGGYDRSYIYAKELLNQGMSVLYSSIPYDTDKVTVTQEMTTSSSMVTAFYNELPNQLKLLKDRNEYTVKYITTGGYPVLFEDTTKDTLTIKDKEIGSYKLAKLMMEVAAHRGDAVALIDYQYDTTNTVPAIYKEIDKLITTTTTNYEYPSFGGIMYPWGNYNCNRTLGSLKDEPVAKLPASFGYLMCVAKAIKTSPNWLAMAGVARGVVPNLISLCTNGVLTNTIAEDCQPRFGNPDTNASISINCITQVRPYGLTLWGNRTLKPVSDKGTDALNFLNTRNMISDIKKLLYVTANSLMFEQNSDTLWLRFKSGVSPLLNQLKSGNGISDYKIIKLQTKYDGTDLARGEIAAVVKIFPVNAIEYFELTVEINDSDVTVS